MRRSTRATVACATLAALLLAGCSANEPDGALDPDQPSTQPSTSTSPSTGPRPQPTGQVDHAADVEALAGVRLTGNLGTMPFFSADTPLTLTGEVARVADQGTGRAVEQGHAVAVHVAVFNAQTDVIEASTYEETQGPELLLAEEGSLPPVLFEAMVGARVGSRVLFGTPTDDDTMIYSFEILATAPVFERAEGEAVPAREGLPIISLADDGEPSMTPAPGDPPSGVTAQTLIKGDGDPINSDSWVVVRSSMWLWDGTSVVSTWSDDQPSVLHLTNAIVGWQEGLAGQTIGSQVLLVVPPDKAFGDEEAERIPAGSTVVYVVDILAGM